MGQSEFVNKVLRCKEDHYKVLGVNKEATDDEIRKAYKKVALELHPDKNKAPGAEEAFKILGAAYAILSDFQKRLEYDEQIEYEDYKKLINSFRFDPYSDKAFHQNYSEQQQQYTNDRQEEYPQYTNDNHFDPFFDRGFYQDWNQEQQQESHEKPGYRKVIIGVLFGLTGLTAIYLSKKLFWSRPQPANTPMVPVLASAPMPLSIRKLSTFLLGVPALMLLKTKRFLIYFTVNPKKSILLISSLMYTLFK